MAGLLDMFNNISPEQNQGLLAAAAQILQNSGPSRVPVGIGQALGTGMQAYQQTMEANRVRKLDEQRQAQQDAFQQEYRTVQMDGLKAQKAERDAGMARRAKLEQAARESIVGGQLNPQLYASKLAEIDPEAAIDLLRQSAPKPVTYGQPQEVMHNGKPVLAAFDNQGNPKVLQGFSPYNRPSASGSRGAGGGTGGADKPLPTSALKMLVGEEDALATASGIQQELGRVRQQITDGTLTFGPMSNLVNTGRNMLGISSEESRNFASFRSTLEKLRNDSLRLNAGVQTDGDAKRAWNELFTNINDKELVAQRLAEIEQINARAIKQRQANIGTIQGNYGKTAAPTGGATANPFQSSRPKNPPLKGQVKNGYRYIGGEPSDPASWEKI